MSFKEVTALRKAGNPDEAYLMAYNDLLAKVENTLNTNIPSDLPVGRFMKENGHETLWKGDLLIWEKRSLSWVLYDFLKSNLAAEKAEVFLKYLSEIKELDLPGEEKMIFNQLVWQLGKMVFELAKNPVENKTKVKSMFSLIRDFEFSKPDPGYSFLFKAFHKALKDSPEYVEFVTWWELENFLPEDFLKEKLENGKEIMSIAEQAYIAYSKKLLDGDAKEIEGFILPKVIDKHKIKDFLPELDIIIEKYPEYQYPPYYKAKLLFALGEGDNVLSALIPFARKKQSDFWVWDILSDAFHESDERKLACLCRAMLCGAKDEFLINVREKFSDTLIHIQQYPEAKSEIEHIIQTRNENGWKIPGKILNWTNQPWYKDAKNIENCQSFCRKYASVANEILFGDIPEELVVVEFVNRDKQILSFVQSKEKQGFFKYDRLIRKVKVGDILRVRLQKTNQEGRYNALTLSVTENDTMSGVLEGFKGKVTNPLNKQFGFVNNIFISQDIYEKHHLKNGDEISGKAMISFNKNKGIWGWKVIAVQKFVFH